MGATVGTILSYTDPETGERVELDVDGWQVVLDTSVGEVMRCDLVRLVLMVKAFARQDARGGFDHSLTRLPDGTGTLVSAPEYWWDVRVTKSGGESSALTTRASLT